MFFPNCTRNHTITQIALKRLEIDSEILKNIAKGTEKIKNRTRDVAKGGAEGATAPPLLLKERFSKEDDTMPKTR